MNIAEFSIKKNVITIVFTVLMVVMGMEAFKHMSRLEDPEFTIKQAVVVTPYPGASAAEVELEVTDEIEKAVQELGQLWYVESASKRNVSLVKVFIKDKYTKLDLPQVWDELRRKVSDYQRNLPPGAGPSIVNDDFGDVYGIYFAVTGEEYSYKELKDFADILKRELLLVTDVKRVQFLGEQTEQIYIEMQRDKMTRLGITQEEIYTALSDKNLVADSGHVEVAREYIAINPTGEFTTEKQFGDLLISSEGEDLLVFLKDVAQIRRGYVDPPKTMVRVNGKNAISIGISTILGGNVVTMGDGVQKRIQELMPLAPLGMEVVPIYIQSKNVVKAIDDFMANLVAAVVIVVVVLLIFMGLQSGLIIGAILYLTICGTFILMKNHGVFLERISLGALIIALGMLVDNAIVIVDGMKVRIEKGEDALKAAKSVVGQTGLPLLAATAVAIVAFAAIGVSEDSTGEFCRSLFQVLLFSLSMSWITAMTITPLLVKYFIKPKKGAAQGVKKDPYAGKLYQGYRAGLEFCLKRRWLTVACVVGLFVMSMIGFKYVKISFFPSSTTPQFLVDVFFPEGMNLQDTSDKLKKSEDWILSVEGVESVSTVVGGGFLRFMLTYNAELPSTGYGQFIVTVDDYKKIPELIPIVEGKLAEFYPDATIGSKPFQLGPGDGGKIQYRIMGPDGNRLREMAETVKRILEEDGGAKSIRDEWRGKVKVVRPELLESQARRLGITRPSLANALKAGFSGVATGYYREEDDLIPIVARAPQAERDQVADIKDLMVWSPVAAEMIPIGQVVGGFKTIYEDANIWRNDRQKMIRVHADPKTELPNDIVMRVKAKIEKALNVEGSDSPHFNADTLPIKSRKHYPITGDPEYSVAWDGEAENSSKANAAIAGNLPLFMGMMVVIVICLFNAFRQPVIIFLTVPLALIGVTVGLLLCNGAFGFMSLLGLLSLTGMLIKNAIVLIDQINLEIREGKPRFQAIVDSGISRLMPVAMAALTTILGMAPLLLDAFFRDMAITIMFGLGFATVLTLIFVPVLYAIFFRIEAQT